MNTTDLRHLNGRLVLVRSALDRRNPPTALRGTVVVHESDSGRATVQIELEFPQMFSTRAHHRTIELNDEQVAQLLDADGDLALTILLPDRLDPDAPAGSE